MRKFYLIFFLLLFTSSIATAQTVRSTSFDDRETCEKDRGVWREFGNGCADSCEAKFDKTSICTQALTYSCECGKNKCWNGERCTAMQDYQKIFTVRQAREKERLAIAKRARQEQLEENTDSIIGNIIENKRTESTNPSTGISGANSNISQFYDLNQAPADASGAPAPQNQAPAAAGMGQTAPVARAPQLPQVPVGQVVHDPATGDQKVEIPLFFQKKQEAKKAAEEAAKPTTVLDTLPGLPQIPLPN